MIVATFNGLDLILIASTITIAFTLGIHITRRAHELEDERERRYWLSRQRWSDELGDDIPLPWLDDLDDIRRLPEVAQEGPAA